MTFKTIAVHCDADKSLDQRLGMTVDLAGKFHSHLVGLYVRPPFQPPIYFDGSFVADDLFRIHEETCAANQKIALSAFAAATEGRDIAIEQKVAHGLVDKEVVKCSRYSDLMVLSQTNGDMPAATPRDLPEVVALSSGRPALVVPYVPVRRPIGNNVVLCWNNSRESARAASDALPFLEAADKVTALSFRSDESEDMGAQKAGKWLLNHGIKAKVVEEIADGADVGDLVLSRASDLDADLIVMGIYGHTRVHEMMLGGVSRTLLRSMTVPVLMSH
jgi:nucleotide-binding universal stress UspA family protein